ncbi:hypothetical protein CC86DRAFT_400441 [Ophiobolus disseminans]|uniref:DUF7918 domain-containing protein n=1 Tax=Ophiobolus disseminans TaxID=1469910 RepID=A0A6A7AMQ0_9PLEO|nr:hypothetical protein CC86DRAFT_400441 [Ophiobolus disseminans]
MVNGVPLLEHDNEDDAPENPKAITKYIEAQAGAKFSIRTSISNTFHVSQDLGSKTYMDGTMVYSSYESKAWLKSHKEIIIDGIGTKIDSEWIFQPLQFQNLKIASSLKVTQDLMKTVKLLGTITVEFDLGKANATGYRSQASWRRYGGTFVTFNFKYRSKADLRALHIIPRTPSPDPEPSYTPSAAQQSHTSSTGSRDEFAGLTKEDMIMIIGEYRGSERGLQLLTRIELQAMLKQDRKKAQNKVKRERSIGPSEGDDDDVVVVQRPARKRGRGKDSEVIVLD